MRKERGTYLPTALFNALHRRSTYISAVSMAVAVVVAGSKNHSHTHTYPKQRWQRQQRPTTNDVDGPRQTAEEWAGSRCLAAATTQQLCKRAAALTIGPFALASQHGRFSAARSARHIHTHT
uniref:Secreted protein n=1 Tax=Ditylenchus dipsaci TaxID=166011 RepID=A0A915DRU0_9BILA